MASQQTFHCTVVTPERSLLDCEAKFAALPAWDGEIGILHDRAPILCRLGIGVLRVETSAEKHVLYIEGGFAEMADNRLTILTEMAMSAAEIEVDEVASQQAAARAMKVTDEASYAARQRALQQARVKQRLVGGL